MTVTQRPTELGEQPSSLPTTAARALSSTTKTPPQNRQSTPRWLLRVLPWVEVPGGSYRVNQRSAVDGGDNLVGFTTSSSQARVAPPELRRLPLLRGLADDDALTALADAFVQHEYPAGEPIVRAGQPRERIVLIVRGKVRKLGTGAYGDGTELAVWAEGNYFGDELLAGESGDWAFSATAATACTVLALDRRALSEVAGRFDTLSGHVRRLVAEARRPRNKRGEAAVDLAAGHVGEPVLPGTFVDYEASPREYELSVAQTVLRVHSRVADLYNQPMDQVEQQLRLTIEALRERQEHELVNNPDFGLLANVDRQQRLHTRAGPPTPEDLDDLLCRRRKTQFLIAHPRAIAAFGRQCNGRGIYPATTEVDGRPARTWRGVPLLPCDKVPIGTDGTSAVLAMRTGEQAQGVIGLHQTGLPDEYQPGLSVRFMGISEQAIISYLVGAYYSAAVLVPDALGVLDNVEVDR